MDLPEPDSRDGDWRVAYFVKPTQDEMNRLMVMFEKGELHIDHEYMSPEILPSALAVVVEHLRHEWGTPEDDKTHIRRTVTGVKRAGSIIPIAVVSTTDTKYTRVTSPKTAESIINNAQGIAAEDKK